MGYLKFDKSLLINLEKSLTKQMLRTNKKGAYSVTTITDCNTSKYDGLLVTPLPELDGENYVLLSSLDETVIQHGAEFNMGMVTTIVLKDTNIFENSKLTLLLAQLIELEV